MNYKNKFKIKENLIKNSLMMYLEKVKVLYKLIIN